MCDCFATSAGTLEYYGGNYSRYVATREENAVNTLKKYEKEQSDIKHLEESRREGSVMRCDDAAVF